MLWVLNQFGAGERGFAERVGWEDQNLACSLGRMYFEDPVPGADGWAVEVASLAGSRDVVVFFGRTWPQLWLE